MVASKRPILNDIVQERLGTKVDISIPAPVGGLNTRDVLSSMDEKDAVIMENMFPDVGKVVSRKGHVEALDTLSGNVETIIEFITSAVDKMITASDGNLYTGSSGTAVSLGTGFTNARWQHVVFNEILCMLNGADTPQQYDGTTLSNLTMTGTGFTATEMDDIHIFKGRMFVYDNNKPEFWYAAIDTLGGTMTKFPLSRVSGRGGNIVKMATWNLEGGDQAADAYAVFFMSNDEAIVYKGTDPGVAANWTIVGVLKSPSPLHKRAVIELNGDVIFATRFGLLSFKQLFSKGGFDPSDTNKIVGDIRSLAKSYGDNFGWQLVHYPQASWLVLNVPKSTNTTYFQYVGNTVAGGWCKFTNMNGRCWGVYNNNLYFGGSTKVYQADSGFLDDTAGIPIDCQTAYSLLGTSETKNVNYFEPSMKIDGNVNLSFCICYDFKPAQLSQSISVASVGTPYGSPYGSPWSTPTAIKKRKYFSDNQGIYVSVRLKTLLKGQQIEWFNTNFSFNVNNL